MTRMASGHPISVAPGTALFRGSLYVAIGAVSNNDLLPAKTEGEGFEPSSEESPPKQFSRLPHSTALPPLRATRALEGYRHETVSGGFVRLPAVVLVDRDGGLLEQMRGQAAIPRWAESPLDGRPCDWPGLR
jgi:hypothetical protein